MDDPSSKLVLYELRMVQYGTCSDRDSRKVKLSLLQYNAMQLDHEDVEQWRHVPNTSPAPFSQMAMTEEEDLMQALAEAEEDDIPDDGGIEIDSDEDTLDESNEILCDEEAEDNEEVEEAEIKRKRNSGRHEKLCEKGRGH
ncbi:hypothetical protein B0H14DRAFT_2560414 [Mycena olivaceomarginata]|nr:hypothetical protein B0H14DRAFT_2560414 [Mycena olivaceomarginata]